MSDVRREITALKEQVKALKHRVKAERRQAATALLLAREIQAAELKVFEVRLSVLQTLVNSQGMKFALWAGVGTGIAFFVGQVVGKQ